MKRMISETQDPTIPHKHQCGLVIISRYILSIGCGHVWEHCKETPFESMAEYVAHHKCPACGKGPWYTVYE